MNKWNNRMKFCKFALSRILLIILILAISFLLLSCGQQSGKQGMVNYKTGVKELQPGFDDTFFPKEIYQNSPLSLTVKLRNNAAYDVNNVKTAIAGLDSYYVELRPDGDSIDVIEGKSAFNPKGGETDVTFEGTTKSLLPGAEYNTQNFRLFVNYDSKMEFFPTVCINPSLYEVYDSGCKMPSNTVSYSGQGAPLAVTKMDQIVRSGYTGEIEFRFEVTNRGKGKVSKVRLGTTKIGNEPLSCELRGGKLISLREMQLDSRKQRVELVCVKALKDRNSYTTTLFVEMFYDYELNVRKNLKIRQ